MSAILKRVAIPRSLNNPLVISCRRWLCIWAKMHCEAAYVLIITFVKLPGHHLGRILIQDLHCRARDPTNDTVRAGLYIIAGLCSCHCSMVVGKIDLDFLTQ